MLKFAGKFKKGQEIRGYDFKFDRESYMQGVVLDECKVVQGAHMYELMPTARKLGGEDVPFDADERFYVPHQVSIFEYDGRIEEVRK